MLSRMNWLFIILAAGLGYFYRVFQPTYDSDEIIDRTVKPPPLTHDSEAKANKKFTSGLYESSKVMEYDATEFQRQFEGELVSYWNEDFLVHKEGGASVEELPAYLDNIRRNHKGVDDEMRKRMNSIIYTSNWAETSYTFNCDEDSKVCRILFSDIVFAKSTDEKHVACIHAVYTLEFKIAPEVTRFVENHSALWGLFTWQTTHSVVVDRYLGLKTLNQLENFLTYRYIQGLKKRGYIDSNNNMIPRVN